MCLSLSLLVIIVIAVLLVNYFRKSNAESKKAIEALAQLHKAENDIKTVQNDADERTKAFQEWVNSNMLLDSDSKISHKDAMKYEQKEELKKNLLESNSETVIMKKKSIGKIEKVNKE